MHALPPTPNHNGASRSPFMPVRKHGSSSSSSFTLSPPTSPRASTTVATGAPGTTPRLPHNMLTSSQAHNIHHEQHNSDKHMVPATTQPKFNLMPSTPEPQQHRLVNKKSIHNLQASNNSRPMTPTMPSAPSHHVTGARSQLGESVHTPSTFAVNSSPLSTAPKIRAKVTAVAAPRKKPVLVGTENVIVPAVGATGLGNSRKPLLANNQAPIVYPRGQGYGAFPSNNQFTSSSQTATKTVDNLARLAMGQVATASYPTQALAPSHFSNTSESTSRSAGATRLYRSAKGKDNVLVCVRVRPPAAKLVAAAGSVTADDQMWHADQTTGRVQLKTGTQDFVFDSVVTGSDNESVYEEAGKDLVLAAMEGFDSVIFAYGQTASGKTFTLTGNAANPGIIPQSVTEIFAYIREHPEQEFLLRASYLEIYNETLKDLLAPESGALRIRQDDKKRFFVSPLREEVVTHEAQVASLLKRGEQNRSTIESRARDDVMAPPALSSHQIDSGAPGTPRLAKNCGGPVRMSTLSLIDLAGSEQATSQAERRSEGAFINKSLLTLEKVIASLTEDSKRKPHVPYRDSKLTQILQPSLSGDARVAVIATINPSSSAVEESKSTLKFATRVKKVQLKAVVNEVIDDKALITKYRAEIARLQMALQVAQTTGTGSAPGTPTTMAIRDAETTSQMQEMQDQLSDLRSLIVTSRDVGDRRRSLQPSRPVSPMKARAARRSLLASKNSLIEEDETEISSQDNDNSPEPTLSEKLTEAQDEIDYLKSENNDLRLRVNELEQDKLLTLSALANESTKDAKIAQLVKDNQELLVVVKNQDHEGDMRRLETRFKREMEKRDEVEKRLRDEIEFERNRIKKMEKFIIDRIQTSYDLIMGKLPQQEQTSMFTSTGLTTSTSTMSFGGLVGGAHAFLPIISERSPEVGGTLASKHLAPGGGFGQGRPSSAFDHTFDLNDRHTDQFERGDTILEDEEFGQFEFLSKETRDTLKRSGSVMLMHQHNAMR
ncbi:Kinesin-like protein kip2 [Microbotryomycetes sp. JL221]|nr:Kinesin-like protein kip2 [Microbotryomycetes sp. JL221]